MEHNKENSNVESRTSYYDCMKFELQYYADIWKLSEFELIANGSDGCVIKCHSADYGKAILKMRNPVKVIEDEYITLVEYNGRGLCKPFLVDLIHGVLLEEQIEPGTVLRKVSSLDERLLIFCALHQRLHIPSSNPTAYRTYIDWVTRITSYMANRSDYHELYNHMKEAEIHCLVVSSISTYNAVTWRFAS